MNYWVLRQITAALGLTSLAGHAQTVRPLLIGQYHGDRAVVAAIGMLAGFCGTLKTPMGANFNVVPAALPLLAVNIALIWFLAF